MTVYFRFGHFQTTLRILKRLMFGYQARFERAAPILRSHETNLLIGTVARRRVLHPQTFSGRHRRDSFSYQPRELVLFALIYHQFLTHGEENQNTPTIGSYVHGKRVILSNRGKSVKAGDVSKVSRLYIPSTAYRLRATGLDLIRLLLRISR